MNLAKRSVHSAAWTSSTTLISLPVGFLQSILLARLLPVEYFGIFAGVNSLLAICATFFEFGFINALIHRAPETEDETHASHVFFTLRIIFESVSAVSLTVFGMIAFTGVRQQALIILVVAMFFYRTTQVPRILLVRRVEHRRLAIIDLNVTIISAVISISIAFAAHSIYALFVSAYIAIIAGFIGFYLYKPFWSPRLVWDLPIIRYFIRFGSRNLVNNMLDVALENVDYLWTNIFLGDVLLGYYSRAFKFAIYPRQILSNPVNTIAVGTYAELKYDRFRLSRAFFQINALLIRTGFLMAVWLAVIAPYFIRLLLGVRWLPMLDAFRLMLVFTMLDPIKVTISSILMTVGVPQKITIIRVTQLIVLLIGLFSLGIRYQIAGVALAVDLMLVVGTILSLYFVRAYIDVSLPRLFTAPTLSLAAALGVSLLANAYLPFPDSDWLTAGIKSVISIGVYAGVLYLMEGKVLLQNIKEILAIIALPESISSRLHLPDRRP